ncbi:MAG: tetratricopeptide repeat protein [Nitrospirae bacterium]|nr:tetratricopeptide repeat protein [Nitrospirota bacterium]
MKVTSDKAKLFLAVTILLLVVQTAIAEDLLSYHEKTGTLEIILAKLSQAEPTFFVPITAQDYFNRAEKYHKEDQIDRALLDYDKALDIDPAMVMAYERRGSIYAREEKYERAVADFNRAIGLNLHTASVFAMRGAAYSDLKEYELAIDDLSRSIKMDSKRADTYRLRGEAYSVLHDYGMAAADMKKSIELNPKACCEFHMLGDYLMQQGETEQAIIQYTKATECEPNHDTAYIHRGLVYYRTGRFANAFADFTSVTDKARTYDYVLLYAHIAGRKSNIQGLDDFTHMLSVLFSKKSADQWIVQLAGYLLGDSMNEGKLIEEAKKGKDTDDINGRLCEAYYFIAEKLLLQGATGMAEEYFRKSIDTGVQDFMEPETSKAMLRMLDGNEK